MSNEKSLRLFIAIAVPYEIIEHAKRIQQDLNNIDGIKLIEEENLHITLKFLGEVSYDKIEFIENSLREISFKKFSINYKGVGVYPNEKYIRVVWLGCLSEELIRLAANINNQLSNLFPKEEVAPHLTIARVKRKIDLSDFLKKHREENFATFECTNFELKSSTLTKQGPKYETLAVFEANR